MMKYMSLVLHECINDQTDDHFPLVDKPPGQVGGVGITRATVHYLEPHPCTVYPRRVLVPWSRAILGGVLQILCCSEIASAVSSAGKLRSSPAKADCYCLVTQLCCLFATPWTAARQASLSSTLSQSLLRLMSIESIVDIQLSHPLLSLSPSATNLSQHQGLFQCSGSSHQVAKVLELQVQHQCFL